jgi:hypothetical protein
MKKTVKHALLAMAMAMATSAAVHATATPTPAPTAAPPETAGEVRFVASVTADLQERFATTAEAAAAGYFQYTPEDQTGAISWVNTRSWQSDKSHPSQLWYDVKGRLIGADFSVLQSGSAARPDIWGISSARWIDFSPAHVHFAIRTPSGLQYGGVGPKTFAKVGGSVAHPTAADIVALGKLKRWKVLGIPAAASTADVAFVFPFPAVWDLQVWLIPNPLGAFAEYNPNVKPSAAATYQD